MHSKDRTMIAAFGFRDPDKRDRRHDMACQYVGKPEVAAKFFAGEKDRQKIGPYFEVEVRRCPAGRGSVRPLIGFVDVLLVRSWPYRYEGEEKEFLRSEYIAIEVKILPVSIGDIIRQIRFYRQEMASSETTGAYVDDFSNVPFVAVTAFALTADDVAMLKNEGIRHVFLGAGFEQFCEASRASDQKSNSLEI